MRVGRITWWVCLALLLPLALQPQDSPFGRKAPKKSSKKDKDKKGPKAKKAEEDGRPELEKGKISELKKLIREYFTNPSAETLAKVDAIDKEFAVRKKDIDSLFRYMQPLARKGVRHQGSTSGRVRYNHPEHKGEYIINASAAGSNSSLWISLHGGGKGAGDPGTSAPRLGGIAGPHIKVYPAVKEKTDTAWNTEREELWVLELIQGLRRSFSIDTNRIYLVGHSMGGFGTWSIGCNHADIFAGIAPMAGGLFPRNIIVNLKNTPVYFYHSTDDKRVGPKSDQWNAKRLKELKKEYGPYDYIYREYSNIGHGYPREGVSPIYRWLQGKKRNPYPKHVIWSPYRSYKTLFYWVKCGSVGRGAQIEAQIERGNRITLSGSVSEIFINEKMGISLSKEVVIESGGSEVFRGTVRRSVAALLESFEAKRDPRMYFYAKVKLN
jgi:predicted esterase